MTRRLPPLRLICAALLLLGVVALLPTTVDATHSWGPYHWQRTSAAIKNIPVRRYHSAIWVTRYNTAITDWRKSAMTKIRPYTAFIGGVNASCPTVTGAISSCDGSYGNTGWLGLATIYLTSGNHIAKGKSRVNNTYFNRSPYNTTAYRQFVICQEIGHNFGLGHVNEIFNNPNTGSCMDYTNDPDGGAGGASPTDKNNMHPNAHDYSLINSKHNHIGFIAPEMAAAELAVPRALEAYDPVVESQFGKLVYSANGGRTQRFELEFANGWKAANWVIWAVPPDQRR